MSKAKDNQARNKNRKLKKEIKYLKESSLGSLSNQVAELLSSLSLASNEISTLAGDLETAKESISAQAQKILDLESRVETLENPS